MFRILNYESKIIQFNIRKEKGQLDGIASLQVLKMCKKKLNLQYKTIFTICDQNTAEFFLQCPVYFS